MLTGIHFLLSYVCNFECDHCFLYCGPHAEGTFTLQQLRLVYKEIDQMRAVTQVYLEGGEPFLFYPVMIEAARLAHERQLKVGFVTNCYWATDLEDARLWLKPLQSLNIYDFSISDDAYHHGEGDNPAKRAYQALHSMGLPVRTICIEEPTVDKHPEKGQPVVGGGAMFRGRAADKLTQGLPVRSFEELTSCPHEELVAPGRVHLDAFGHVHICQGISMGNMWQTPLAELDRTYNASQHPICGPLVAGGPVELARTYGLAHEDAYVDECHACYRLRQALLDRFPDYLAPRQVYGMPQNAAG